MIFMKKHGIFAVLSVLIAIVLSLSAVFFIGCDKGENPDDSSKKTSSSSDRENGSQNGSQNGSSGGLKDGGIFETH